MKIFILFTLVISFVSTAFADNRDAFFSFVKNAEDNYSKVDSYRAINFQKELVEGSLIVQDSIIFKYKKPHLVYMGKTTGKDKGSEIIYNKKVYGDEIVYHAGGFLGVMTMNLDPNGSLVKKENRHVIYEAGVGYIIKLLSKTAQLIEDGSQAKVTSLGEKKRDGINLNFFEIESSDKSFYAYRVKVGFRDKDSLPVLIYVYNSEGGLLEEYYFKNLSYNKPVLAEEFSTEYKGYNY